MPAPSSTPHGGDRIAQALQAHGVRSIFTLCGGHISPILTAARQRGIRIVDVRDEVTAVFADTPFRPLETTPRPSIHGVQSAHQIIEQTIAEFHAISARLGALAAEVTAQAILNAIGMATGLPGLPAAGELG